jgi:hypothetical protein
LLINCVFIAGPSPKVEISVDEQLSNDESLTGILSDVWASLTGAGGDMVRAALSKAL